jgi:hypothetical protein
MDMPSIPTMDCAEVASCRENSLEKMKIAYLLSDKLGAEQTKDYAKTTTGEDNINAWMQHQDVSTMKAGGLDFGNHRERIEHWVTSLPFAQSTNWDSSCVRYSKDGIIYGQRPSFQMQLGDHVVAASPPSKPPLSDHQTVLAGTEWARSGDFTSPTSKRCRPRRSVYTRDEKLFIMHAHVIGKISWQNISTMFKTLFGGKDARHTVSSLRSVYNRTRREWGMDYATRSGLDQRQNEESIVNMKLSEHARGSGTPGLAFQA